MKLFFYFLVIMCYSLSAQENITPEKKERIGIKTLVAAAEKLATYDRSCAEDGDCVQFPIGSRACGGPNGYILTSRLNSLLDEVEYLARQSEIKESAFNQKYGIYSICSIVPKPIVKCVSKVCR